jgi:hypothetical protein
MNKLMNEFERISNSTGSAVAIVGHYPKGSTATRLAGDRMSGSGVFLRVTDSLLELTPAEGQEDEPCPDLDVTGKMRDFPPFKPFVARMEQDKHILIRAEGAKVTTGKSVGRKSSFEPAEMLQLLPETGLPHKDWKAVAEEIGITANQFRAMLKKIKDCCYAETEDSDKGKVYVVTPRGQDCIAHYKMRQASRADKMF